MQYRASKVSPVLVVCTTLLLLGSVTAQGTAPVKIMSLGDSITEGQTGHAGWRYWLWNELQANGYSNVDFIGSQAGAFLGPPLYANYDQDHEGYWGARVDQLIQHMPSVFGRGHVPDIALIHVGHNDIIQSQSVVVTAGEILSLISEIRSVNRDCKFFVAKVIPTFDPWAAANLQLLNALIEAWSPSYALPTSPIVIVDQATGFDPIADLYDGVHPNEFGEKKMSEKWLRALAPALGSFKVTLSYDQTTGFISARNLAGPPNEDYVSVITTDPANANGGLGTGWFGGLHIPWSGLVAQVTAFGNPFTGQLDAHGASFGTHMSPVPPGLIGVPFYAVSVAIGHRTGALLGFGSPASVTAQ
ncbi:MAG: hypothetical protein HRU14_05345 [Planctomycetes bacterium]|nr:hypothetical protein [Planctomycetota bacterium]